MEFLSTGKRRYALGLSWGEVAASSVTAQAKRAIGKSKGLYFVQTGRDGAKRLGVGLATTLPKGRVFSAAAAIAALGEDGVFGVPQGDGCWYVAVQDGGIVAGTDRFVPFEQALDAMVALSSALNLSLYWSGAEEIPGAQSGQFELAALDGAKIAPMVSVGESQLVGAVMLVCVLAASGYGGWTVINKSKAVDPVLAEQQALEQQKQLYIADTVSKLATVPADSGWVLDAFDAARSKLPLSVSGWVAQGYACDSAKCVGTYKAQPIHAVDSVVRAYGGDKNVAVLDDGKALTIRTNLKPSPSGWSEAFVQSPPVWKRSAADIAGLLPLAFNVIVEQPKVEPIDPSFQAMEGITELVRESIVVRSEGEPDRAMLAVLANTFAKDGFVSETLAVSRGEKGASWRVEFQRIKARS